MERELLLLTQRVIKLENELSAFRTVEVDEFRDGVFTRFMHMETRLHELEEARKVQRTLNEKFSTVAQTTVKQGEPKTVRKSLLNMVSWR